MHPSPVSDPDPPPAGSSASRSSGVRPVDRAHAPDWHAHPAADVLARLDSSTEGLTVTEATDRLERHGRNELLDRGSKSPFRILWQQLTEVMVVILLGASVLSLALGQYLEAGAIGAIVVLFALLGLLQEYRAERAIAALRQLAVPTVRAVRSGQPVELSAAELVPGDLVRLEAGTVVPADVRLTEAVNLRIQEATLTGESEPVDKHTDPITEPGPALGDRRSMAYSGTEVVYGRASGVVVATGMDTELGRIASLLQGVERDRTPLQNRLDLVGKQLALAGVAVALVVMALGAASGGTFTDLLLTAISVAVAVIPEGLPAVVTFTLAIGSQRMLRRNALIRKLPAVETLGSVDVICSDKTGTLTRNQMTVTVLDVAGTRLHFDGAAGLSIRPEDETPPAVPLTLVAGVLCNDAALRPIGRSAEAGGDGAVGAGVGGHGDSGDEEAVGVGDPTEVALLRAARSVGIDVEAVRDRVPRVGEQPFASDRKRMSTVHAPLGGREPSLAALPQDRPVAFVKGAVDRLLERSVAMWADDGPIDLDDGGRGRIAAANDELAAGGMRVLGVAYRTLGSTGDVEHAEDDLVMVGLIGIIDPPRREVRDAVTVCRRAGIRPVMITGDHPLTARAIASDLGISETGEVTTGAELDDLDDAELAELASRVSVFARVSPEHKLRIVASLQNKGRVVAMTGDGVNDAPALKRADIGVAMGVTGTDVSKEASDMVLRDDNFATIVAAVEEGRVIYDNLRRFVSFAVAGNLGKIIVMLLWPIPYLLTGGRVDSGVALLPLQLLWLNLMTDGLLGLSMGMEPAEPRVMDRSPHAPSASLWAGGLGRQTVWVGVFIGVVALGLGFGYHEAGRDEWQTVLVLSLAFLQVFQAIGTRSYTESLTTIGLTTNRAMVGLASLVAGLQLIAVYTPLADFLDLEPLPWPDLAVTVASGVVLLVLLELSKARMRDRRRSDPSTGVDRPAASAPPR